MLIDTTDKQKVTKAACEEFAKGNIVQVSRRYKRKTPVKEIKKNQLP